VSGDGDRPTLALQWNWTELHCSEIQLRAAGWSYIQFRGQGCRWCTLPDIQWAQTARNPR